MAEQRSAYSYRQDDGVPDFPDDKPLFVFDGVCVLCSGGASWLMRHDRAGRFRFATAQSTVGAALYAHYGMAMDDTYLLIDRGHVFVKSDGYLRIAAILGGWWRLCAVAHLVPLCAMRFMMSSRATAIAGSARRTIAR
jgi:predicted DCC family thiol-disulfide oxidoreductase YuxK